MNAEQIIVGMYKVIEDAVENGNLEINDDCDIDYLMDAAEIYLRGKWYYKNAIDGGWCK